MVTVRTIAEIRDALLSYWAAEYLANGEVLLTAPGSDAYLLAGMIAIVQNACDVQALQVSRDILPDQASNGAIERFGYVYGVSRTPAVAARLHGASMADVTLTMTTESLGGSDRVARLSWVYAYTIDTPFISRTLLRFDSSIITPLRNV